MLKVLGYILFINNPLINFFFTIIFLFVIKYPMILVTNNIQNSITIFITLILK